MAGAAFNKITVTGTTLTQIKPVGYLANPNWVGKKKSGCKGFIKVQFLTSAGKIAKDGDDEMEFLWYHTSANGVWNDDAGWKQYKGGVLTDITSANDVAIGQGEALWFKVTSGWVDGIRIQSSGNALVDSQTVPLRDGSTAVMVPISKDCKLTDFVPGGYLANPNWVGKKKSGCKGFIKVQFLTSGGKIAKDGDDEMEYLWYHTSANGVWNDDAGWKQYKGGVLTDITVANAPTIKMSEGVWVKVTSGWVSGINVAGPGLND